ncbi:SIR2 family protein [Domibacillus mangrovi]|uniref:Uncharacterized protein n=1 Tax=Domibacillus mangrovi TaxID=1714354 RepID=A0A1Q5P000_9BACI|nr:SIR2 family protein [Domibacillus mangrovi]OKL35493.1 hypothetical protein BLL40_15150 [Domibacillus mangrovi]
MKKENRVTCLLGAGAAIDINGPTTYAITEKVKKHDDFLKGVCDTLEQYYGQEGYNFEDVFHAIETLASYTSREDKTLKRFKPALGAFIDPKEPMFFDRFNLTQARTTILKILAEEISKYDTLENVSENKWYSEFWRKLNKNSPLDVGTLNYDNTIQKILKENVTDGFEKVDGELYDRFNPTTIIGTDKTRIMNLHGSIYYGKARGKDPNRHILEDNPHDLYQYKDHDTAFKTWFGSSSYTNQAGEKAEISPIITGLRKLDKLSVHPLSVYNSLFTDSISSNSSLLVCGYSFGDLHINSVLERMASIHGNKRRIVLIVYLSDYWKENWSSDLSVMKCFSLNIRRFLAKTFQETRPLASNFFFENPIISQDGLVRVYFDGFKKTVEDYGKEIIEFLTAEVDNKKIDL